MVSHFLKCFPQNYSQDEKEHDQAALVKCIFFKFSEKFYLLQT